MKRLSALLVVLCVVSQAADPFDPIYIRHQLTEIQDRVLTQEAALTAEKSRWIRARERSKRLEKTAKHALPERKLLEAAFLERFHAALVAQNEELLRTERAEENIWRVHLAQSAGLTSTPSALEKAYAQLWESKGAVYRAMRVTAQVESDYYTEYHQNLMKLRASGAVADQTVNDAAFRAEDSKRNILLATERLKNAEQFAH